MILAAGNALASALTSRSFASRLAWSYSWPMLHSAPHGEFASTSTVSCTLAFAFIFLSIFLFGYRCSLPNKSPKPTAVGAFSSAVAVHVTSRRWLSFFRSASLARGRFVRLYDHHRKGCCLAIRMALPQSCGLWLPRSGLARFHPHQRSIQPRIRLGVQCRRRRAVLTRRSRAIAVTPNKSPEATAVGACRSAVAVHVASRQWLSFFR